jgi:hypothetical protein
VFYTFELAGLPARLGGELILEEADRGPWLRSALASLTTRVEFARRNTPISSNRLILSISKELIGGFLRFRRVRCLGSRWPRFRV